MALTVKQKTGEEAYKTLLKAEIKEYVGLGMEQLSVIEKGKSMLLLIDQTRILVPQTMRKRLMDREYLAHPGIMKIQNNLRAK